MNAAVAEVTTRFGTEVTVAFFPDRSRKAKQLKMYERNAMKDFMPVVSEEKNEHLYRCALSTAKSRLLLVFLFFFFSTLSFCVGQFACVDGACAAVANARCVSR